MKSLTHINKYFYKYRWRLLLGVIFTAISNIFAIFSVEYLGSAIDFLKKVFSAESSPESIKKELIYYFFMVISFALISGFFLFLMRQTIIVMSRLIEYDLKNEIFEKYQSLSLSFYKQNNTGDLMNRISEDVSRVRMYIGPAIMYILNTAFTFGLTVYAMSKVNVSLTVYVLLPLPLLAISIYFVSDIINKKSNKVQAQLSSITTHTQEAFSGIRILKAYEKEKQSAGEMDIKNREYMRFTMSMVKTEALFQPFMILLIGLSTIITVYLGGVKVIDGEISYGNVAEFVVYINRLMWPIASLGWVTSLIQRAAASQSRINEFLHTSPEIQNHSNKAETIKGEIVFKNVSFTYPDSGIQALKNISFSIKAGQTIAIIGKTGSGKSSIANLICRLYDCTEGSISIDGINIKQHNLPHLRRQIGYVPQEVFLFSDSVANNIAFGNQNSTIEAIKKAASDAAIYSNIEAFPDKFETMVGERGITLSGGQKQRISIARAIIKEPHILIFDDCLSAVDTETEEQILNNLKKIMQNRSTLIISHRISSVKSADNIIVLDNGSIVESGTHEELLNKSGHYSKLYKLQLANQS